MKRSQRSWLQWAQLLPLVAILGLIGFTALITVYSSDDYWYSVFMDQGPLGYFKLMGEHYLTFNGRVLVHVVAHLILFAGNWLFALFVLGCCVAVPWLLWRTQRPSQGGYLPYLVLFAIVLLAMPTPLYKQGMMWVSASCNYLLPTLLLCSLFPLATRVRDGQTLDPKARRLLLAMAFLCGATTEQTGLMGILVVGYYWVSCRWTGANRSRPLLWGALAALAGWLTIFCSPATLGRLFSETNTLGEATLAQKLVGGFMDQTQLLTGSLTVPLLLLAVLLAGGVILFEKWGKAPWLWGLLLPVVAVMAIPFCPEKFKAVLLLVALVGLLAMAVLLLFTHQEWVGVLLLAAVGSLLVMLPTASVDARTLLPFYLLTAAAATALLAPAVPKLRFSVLALGVLVVVAFVPTLQGFWYNHQVDALNRQHVVEAAGKTRLDYCVDYDMDYTEYKAHSDGYFMQKYVESVGRDLTNTKVWFYSNRYPTVFCAGTELSFPAMPEGEDYALPVDEIVTAAGGTVYWHDGITDISYRGVDYTLTPKKGSSSAKITWTDPQGVEQTYESECEGLYTNICTRQGFVTDVLGIALERDVENNRLILKP